MNDLLRMRNVHLRYGTNHALNGVDFHLREGEIHALVGENRSGKTSLMRVLAGEVRPNRGEIRVRNKAVTLHRPLDAVAAGIGIVHQKRQIIPNLNAVEFIFARQLPRVWFRFRQYGEFVRRAREILERIGFSSINLVVPIGTLPEAEQLAVEFARIVAWDPQIVVLDEVARRQNRVEMDRLFELMQGFRDAGKGVVYITNDLNEVFEIADRVTVMAEGHRKSTDLVKNLDRMRLIRLAFNLAVDQQDDATPLALRQFNETVIRDLPVGVFIVDHDDRVFYTNEEAARICGASTGTITGTAIDAVLLHHAGNAASDIASTMRSNAKGAWEGIPFGCAPVARVQSNTIRDDENAIIGRVILVQDTTLNRSVAEYLARTEKLASTAELAAGVAHEINNPLGTIRNYIEILKLRKLDEDTTDKLERITREMDRIVEIIGSLLSFSRVQPARYEIVFLQDLLDEVVTLMNHRFAEKRVALNQTYADEPIFARVDENRMKQVFINILANALDATLEGDSVTIGIAVDRDPQPWSAVVTVEDSGCGIVPDAREQIFAPFFSTKTNKTNTGLGLSISKHIVENHDGTIEIDSVTGERTTVTVRLPFCEEPE